MNKITKASLALSLLFSIYACPTANVVTPQPSGSTVPQDLPNQPAASSTNTPLTNNEPKPYSRPNDNSQIITSNPTPVAIGSATNNTTPVGQTGSAGGGGGTTPSGQTGNSSDIKELATFNGKILDKNGNPIEGAIVTARSIDSSVNWVGQPQVTVGGAYVFRNAPAGAKIQITINKSGFSRTVNQVLKSNLQGDPNANVFDFSDFYSSSEMTSLLLSIYDGENNPVQNSKVTIRSLEPDFIFFQEYDLKNENILTIPEGQILGNIRLKIIVNANGKQKEREIITRGQGATTEVSFGGLLEQNKSFAIANLVLDPSINKFIETYQNNLSTFSIDTNTASYSLMRNSILNADSFPSRDSVRIEEYVNYFDYNYAQPQGNSKFSINTQIAPSVFDKSGNKHIFRIGIQGKEIKSQNRKNSVLTFLIDTSGSMADDNKLETIKNSLKIMLKQLKITDKVAIITYNDKATTVLTYTLVRDEKKIVDAIDSLKAGSLTDIEKGLTQAYKEAQSAYDANYLNRIILCSDGINSTAISSAEDLLKKVKSTVEVNNISLSSMGVGFKNYNDTFLEKLASNSDGYYSYIDNEKEAVRIFVENSTDILQVIAKDVKIQVDFNPLNVIRYRLIGYDNKVLDNRDFRNDNVDAGEIGSNHSVTAIYEIELTKAFKGKIADVNIRYKDVDLKNTALENTKEVYETDVLSDFESSDLSFKLASTIALYGEILRKSYWSENNTFKDVIRYSQNLNKNDKLNEFIEIAKKADTLNQNLK